MNTFSSHARWLGAIFAAGAALGFDVSAHAQDRPTCVTEADCPEGMGCLEQFSNSCTVQVVDGVPRFVCTPVQGDSICTPRHEMPCQIASDCGEGFNCVESFGYACGPTGPDGAYECVPISNHVSFCEVIVQPCTTNDDCPGVLECQLQYVDAPCTGGAGGSAGVEEPNECPPPSQEYRCATPPFGGGTGGVGGEGGTGEAGVGGEPPPDGQGGASGMSAGEGGAGTSGFGGVGGAGGASGSGAGTGGLGAPDDDGEADEHRGHHGRHRGLLKRILRGCTTTTLPSEGGSLGWLMLGAAALLLTRRSRRA